MKVRYIRLLIALLPCMLIGCSSSDDVVEPSLVLNEDELSFTGYQSTLAVKVDATRRWHATASESWVTITPDYYPGADEHFTVNVAVSVSENQTGEPREGWVTFFLQDEKVATLGIKQDIPNEEEKPDEEFPITWANLQWVASTSITEGETLEAGTCVFADGITNVLESTTGEDIVGEIGYSLNPTDPSGDDWIWTSGDCWFNGDWGDNFYYQGRLEGLSEGIYYYTFRLRNGAGPYKYAGTDGLWDGINNVCGTFEVKSDDEEEEIDYSKFSITWANLQWAASTTLSPGSVFEAGAQVFIDGLTNLEDESTTGEGVMCEIGYSLTTSNPQDEDWIWEACWFNGDWGNNFYYQGKTPEIQVAGSYYYTFRFKMGKKGAYAYAGTDGLWDGTNNVCGTFQVTE